ncbi:hypothetical protein ACP70R_015101 [Stipagrostis hirtigluma subsp. patula]
MDFSLLYYEVLLPFRKPIEPPPLDAQVPVQEIKTVQALLYDDLMRPNEYGSNPLYKPYCMTCSMLSLDLYSLQQRLDDKVELEDILSSCRTLSSS